MKDKKKLLSGLVSLLIVLALAVPAWSTVVRAGTPTTEMWDWHELDAISGDLSGGYTLVITLCDVGIHECGDSWTEAGIEITVVETTEEDCAPGYCYFYAYDCQMALCPARLELDLAGLPYSVLRVEADVIDWGGATTAFLYEGTTLLDTDASTTPGSPETLTVVANGSPDRFAVSSCEGSIIEIRVLLNPTEVRDWYDLDNVRYNAAGHYILMNELDATTPGYLELASETANDGKGWQPIGSASYDPDTGEWEAVDPFIGTFDGQGYEIADLFIDRPDEDGVGLFGAVDLGGVITSIGLANTTVTGNRAVAALVGQNWYATVTSSWSTGDVTGHSVVGGLVGRNWYGEVVGSHSAGNVAGEESIGGLIGANSHDGVVTDSWSVASVAGTNAVGGLVGNNHQGSVSTSHGGGSVIGEYRVGGLTGANYLGSITDSSASGSVTGHNWVGGLAGVNIDSSITHSHSAGVVSGTWSTGGLAGTNQDDGVVDHCYATGNVNGGDHAGGLIGWNGNGATMSNSHAIGSVTGNDCIGGLVGSNYLSTVSRSYATGSVTGSHRVGGLLGSNHPGTVINSYSDASVSGATDVGGLVGGNDGTVVDSYARGTVTGDIWVGGLVGANTQEGDISNCYSTGGVSGDASVGGLVGVNYGSVSESYSAGNVIGVGEVGGLVGRNGSGVDWGDDLFSGSVSNSYSTSSVVGHEGTGGLVGYNYLGTITNSYSTGTVTADLGYGGLVGWNDDDVINAFWDMETSGQADSDGGTGKTTADMMKIATFTDTQTEGLDTPWDMIGVTFGEIADSYIWNIVNGETYPFLSWEAAELAIVTQELPDGYVGVAYEQTLEASGGTPPYTWDWTAEEEDQQVPPGLYLAAETCIISGTPAEAGTFNFTVEVTDDEGLTASRLLTIVIAEWDPWFYDENGDGIIQKMEALQAVQDYFAEKIAKAQVLEVIQLYFAG